MSLLLASALPIAYGAYKLTTSLYDKYKENKRYEEQKEFTENQYKDNSDFLDRQLKDNTKYAELNYQLGRDSFEYQKQLNDLTMQREDNAIQRQVADFKNAGFSPLAAIGGSGASSASLSSGEAPSYDMSGVNAVSGKYVDLANEYTQLKQALYSKDRELRQGAKIAMQQLKSDMVFKGLNSATQIFNSKVNARSQLINNEYMSEQLSYLQDKHKWENDNGYRDKNPISALTGAIIEYINSKGEGDTIIERAFDVGKQDASFIKEKVVSATENIAPQVAEKINNSEIAKNYKTAVLFYLGVVKSNVKKSALGVALQKVYDLGQKYYIQIAGE